MRKTKPTINYKVARTLGYTSLGVTGLITLGALFPSTFYSADALENTSVYAESRVSVKATASLSISVDSEVNINLTPSSTGAFGYNSAKLSVSTNNEEGYQLFLSTANGNGSLKNTDINKTGTNHEITSITQNTKGTNFTGNTWGYSLSKSSINENSTYKSIPTKTTSIYTASSAPTATADTYNLGFGTHITPTLASGEYSNSVVVSAIANPIVINNLSQLVYMQDMTPDICANTVYADGTSTNEQYKLNPVTKQLIDIRDGKSYWVAKLADGNCWMTQDLKLNLSTTKTLTPSDTDITSNWTPPISTNTTDAIRVSGLTDYYQSWNIGQIALATPVVNYICPDNISSGNELVTKCGDLFKNVSTWTSGFTATGTTSINESAKTYDSHYLIGNYYQWDAATAGTGPLTDSINPTRAEVGADGSKLVNAAGSICPKGWKMPTEGRQLSPSVGPTFDLEDSFYQLYHAYGAPASDSWTIGQYSNSYPTAGGFVMKPIYLVIAGLIDPKLRALNQGYYYSSTNFPTLSSDNFKSAFDTGFTSYDVQTGSQAFRQFGNRIRCLAK